MQLSYILSLLFIAAGFIDFGYAIKPRIMPPGVRGHNRGQCTNNSCRYGDPKKYRACQDTCTGIKSACLVPRDINLKAICATDAVNAKLGVPDAKLGVPDDVAAVIAAVPIGTKFTKGCTGGFCWAGQGKTRQGLVCPGLLSCPDSRSRCLITIPGGVVYCKASSVEALELRSRFSVARAKHGVSGADADAEGETSRKRIKPSDSSAAPKPKKPSGPNAPGRIVITEEDAAGETDKELNDAGETKLVDTRKWKNPSSSSAAPAKHEVSDKGADGKIDNGPSDTDVEEGETDMWLRIAEETKAYNKQEQR